MKNQDNKSCVITVSNLQNYKKLPIRFFFTFNRKPPLNCMLFFSRIFYDVIACKNRELMEHLVATSMCRTMKAGVDMVQ